MIYQGYAYRDIDDPLFLALLRNPPGRVYFIRCGQYVKIGVSNDPHRRLKQIKSGNSSTHKPQELEVRAAELITTEPGGFDREHELHVRFAHLRHTGEWFTETKELTDYIQELSA